MDKLLIMLKTAHGVKLLLDEVFHSLHVVIGHLLDVLHPLCISRCKLTIDVTQLVEACMIDILQLRQRQFTKSDEILDFHTYAIPDEGILREIRGQGFGFTSITA